jgi:hypothetical protein
MKQKIKSTYNYIAVCHLFSIKPFKKYVHAQAVFIVFASFQHRNRLSLWQTLNPDGDLLMLLCSSNFQIMDVLHLQQRLQLFFVMQGHEEETMTKIPDVLSPKLRTHVYFQNNEKRRLDSKLYYYCPYLKVKYMCLVCFSFIEMLFIKFNINLSGII